MGEPRRRATYEDLMQVPDTKVAEIVDGELFVSPRPALPHAYAATLLGADVVVPDWAGWRRERVPVFPRVPFFTLAPDWICEVISSSAGRLDRSRKMGVYAREGVGHLWFVDPLAQTVEVYRWEAGRWMVVVTHAGDETARIEPFGAVELRLARWWPPPAPAG
jgi:Uma2 family endonuclease